MLTDEGDFHASAFILGPDDTIVLIRDQRKPDPLWKPPGGKRKLIKPFGKKLRDELPLETVLREVKEETGLRLKKSLTSYVATESMGHYNKHYFFSRVSSWRGVFPLSAEYEEPRVFQLEDLKWTSDFHPAYARIYHECIVPLIIDCTAGS